MWILNMKHCQATSHHIEVSKQPEIVNLQKTPVKTPKRNKEDVALENKINEAIETHNAAFARKSA